MITVFSRAGSRRRSDLLSFMISIVTDILKDLYIKELKGYKPAPEAKGADASTQVKEFKTPAAPAAPVVDAAADLSAWEAANVEIADAVSEEAVDEDEEEVEEEEEHHH
ncbi:hypothetical protein BGW39_001943 [Mortierella sp. 14UC]|nr:hypothetical protein BGW39_001943 [Mortierella sp. 14UC]